MEFGFSEDCGAGFLREAVEADQGRVADCLVMLVGGVLLWRIESGLIGKRGAGTADETIYRALSARDLDPVLVWCFHLRHGLGCSGCCCGEAPDAMAEHLGGEWKEEAVARCLIVGKG